MVMTRCPQCGAVDSSWTSGQSLARSPAAPRQPRQSLRCEAKKVTKKTDVVLVTDVQGLGVRGDVTKATYGYFRNFLLPQKRAVPLTDNYLEKLDREEKAKQQAYSRGVAKAQSMATALRTIGKFTITKRAGDGGKIFGSVTPEDVIEAIYNQIGQRLDKASLDLPAIKATGTHQAAIQLHPDVIGRFAIVVNKAKQGK